MQEKSKITIEYEGQILTFSTVRDGTYIFYDASGRVWELTKAQVSAYPQMELIIGKRKE